MAIETAGALFGRKDLRLSINFMPNAVYEPIACIQKSLAAAKRADFPHENLMFELTEDERIADPTHLQNIIDLSQVGFLDSARRLRGGLCRVRPPMPAAT
jgi:EAL domain-containing protein (putative c-di-GMP-specific phosphodiesterase class I)